MEGESIPQPDATTKDMRILRTSALRHVPAALALVIGVLVTLSARHVFTQAEHDRIASEFERLAADRCTAVNQSIDDQLHVLLAVSGLYEASAHVDREQFASFTQRMLDRHASLQALEWIPRVAHDERAQYEANARADGLTDFNITERNDDGALVVAGEREAYFPVYYVTPVAGNEAAIGFDLASNPTRRIALEHSRDSGRPAATSRITLVQETGDQFGVLMFFPHYRDGVENSVASRREHLMGFVLGVHRMGDALSAALRPLEPTAIDLAVLDLAAPKGAQLLARYSGKHHDAAPANELPPDDADFVTATHLTVGDRTWRIVASASSDFIQARASFLPTLLTMSGLFATILSALYLHQLCGRTVRIANVVDERTSELKAQAKQLRHENAERCRAEQSLLDSEWRMRILAENIEQAFWLIDSKETELLYMSPAFETLTGLDCQDMYDDPRAWLRAVHSDDRERARKTMTCDDRRGVDDVREGEFRVVLPDGSLRWLWMCTRPIVDQCGSIAYRAGVAMDITKRRAALLERERLNHALVRTNDELESRNEEVLRLAYAITHDLQTPLATMNGAVEALIARLGDVDDGAQKWMAKIQSSTARMVVMLNDLLTYAKAGAQHIEGERVDIPELIKLAVDELRPQAEEKGAAIHCVCRPCTVRANPSFMLRVLLNVIGNAVKYLPASTDGRVVIAAEQEGAMVRISVMDNGPGIDPRRLGEVFQPFKRANTDKPGTGLGLAIVRKYITSIHGQVTIDSDGRKGTTVGLVIPAIAPPQAEHAEGAAA